MDLLIRDVTLLDGSTGHIGVEENCITHVGPDFPSAPATRTIRGIPTELRLGPDDGMPTDCVVSFDNLRVVPKAYLVDQICALRPPRFAEACAAIQAAIDC